MQTRPDSERIAVDLIDRQFASLIHSLRATTRSIPSDLLYRRPPSPTVGENLLRSAAVLEQTFGGITSNLWDDPFEWTLPETLATPERIIEYLSEVDTVRSRALGSLHNDDVLLQFIAMPFGEPCRLMELLMNTLTRSSEYHGQAVATLKLLSDVGTSGFII